MPCPPNLALPVFKDAYPNCVAADEELDKTLLLALLMPLLLLYTLMRRPLPCHVLRC
jgi:hypothetical protein